MTGTCLTAVDPYIAHSCCSNVGSKQSDSERDLIAAVDELRNQADDALEAGAFFALGVAFVAQADVFVAKLAGGVRSVVHGGAVAR